MQKSCSRWVCDSGLKFATCTLCLAWNLGVLSANQRDACLVVSTMRLIIMEEYNVTSQKVFSWTILRGFVCKCSSVLMQNITLCRNILILINMMSDQNTLLDLVHCTSRVRLQTKSAS